LRAGRLVGNFPQAFSHVSLVNAAYNLSGHAPMAGADGGGRAPAQERRQALGSGRVDERARSGRAGRTHERAGRDIPGGQNEEHEKEVGAMKALTVQP